ncbi:MAG TPA: cytochrome-c peroxidase [Gallionella sp.]|nr:cytochrome-c peroxidase [Gallionella sp.]
MSFDRPRLRRLSVTLLHDRRLLLALFMLVLFGSLLFFLYIPSLPVKTQPDAVYGDEVVGTVEPIVPIPLEIKLDKNKVALGMRLFHDPRLSGDNTVSCANCHGLDHGGADHAIHSRGVGGQEGVINAPTVFNSGFNFRQFWDGRAETLEEQIDGPINNPIEMASNWPQVVSRLSADVEYKKTFSRIYSTGVTAANIKDAIATFERSLYTPNSRFDRFLRGDKAALNADEEAGYRLFKTIGCVSCHQGVNVGGNLYEKMGVMEGYYVTGSVVTKSDLGRYNQTGLDEQRYEFKVPSLRNVALTGPYFHNGSADTLEEATRLMAWHQLGVKLGAAEQRLIADFLRTLTGEYQGVALK